MRDELGEIYDLTGETERIVVIGRLRGHGHGHDALEVCLAHSQLHYADEWTLLIEPGESALAEQLAIPVALHFTVLGGQLGQRLGRLSPPARRSLELLYRSTFTEDPAPPAAVPVGRDYRDLAGPEFERFHTQLCRRTNELQAPYTRLFWPDA